MKFIDKPDSSSDLTIFITSFISSFESINFDLIQTFQLRVAESVDDAVAVNPNGINTVLAKGLSTFPIKTSPVQYNPKSLPKNPPDYSILCNLVFDNFILVEKLFAKALRNLKTCVLVKDTLTAFDDFRNKKRNNKSV